MGHEAAARLRETELISWYLKSTVGPQGCALLLGDLNSLSERDADRHMHSALARGVLASTPKLRKKFLRSESSSAEIDYRPIRCLYLAGLHEPSCLDAGAASCTVPTAVNEDPAHAAEMRLDYCLLSEALALRCPRASSCCVRDALTQQISDHFPVCLDLSPEAHKTP